MPKDSVNVVRKDGSVFETTRAEAERLAILGYKIQTPEEAVTRQVARDNEAIYTTPGQKAITAVEGVASGITLGGSDLLIDDEETRNRASYNPGTRIASEVVGAFVPDLLTLGAATPVTAANLAKTGARVLAKDAAKSVVAHTPAGLVSRAGRAVEESIGGVKGAIAGTALQGAASGAGAVITQAKLSGDEVTTEAVLAGAGLGSLVGGAGGALGYGFNKLGTRALSYVDSPTTTATARVSSSTTDDAVESYIAGMPKVKHGVHDKPWEAAEVAAVEPYKVVKAAGSAPDDTYYASVSRSVRESVDGIGAAAKSVEADIDNALVLIKKQPSSNQTFAELRMAEAAGIPVGMDPKAVALSELKTALNGKSSGEIEKALANFKKVKYNDLPSEVSNAVKSAEGFIKLKKSAEALTDFPTKLADFRRMKSAKFERMLAALENVGSRPEFTAIDESLTATLEQIGLKATGTPVEKARMLYESNKTPEYFKKSSKASLDTNPNPPPAEFPPEAGDFSSQTDINTAVGRTPTDNNSRLPGSDLPDMGGVAPRTNNVIPDLPPKQATVLDDPGVPGPGPGPESTSRVSGKVSKFWQNAFGQVAKRGGSAVGRKLGLGFIGGGIGWQLGGNLSSSLLGASMFSGVAGSRESMTARIRNTAIKYSPRIGRAVTAASPKFSQLAIRVDGSVDEEKDKQKLFKSRMEEIAAVGPGFADNAFQMVEPMIGEQEEFAKGFVKSATNAMSALQKYLPRDPGTAFSRGKSLWKPTDEQIRQAEKALSVFHNPIGTVESLVESRRLDTFTVNALKDMWPGMYQQFQTAMILRISEEGVLDRMSIEDQAHVGILIGMPLNSSHTAKSIAASLTIYAKEVEAAVQNKQKSGGGGGGAGGRPAKSEPPTAGQSLLNM